MEKAKTAAPPPSPLFASIPPEEVPVLLAGLQAERRSYQKGEILLHAGETTGRFGLAAAGTLQIVKEDMDGSATLLAQIRPGELFAEAFAAAGLPLSVSVRAEEEAAVLWLDYRRLTSPCRDAGPFHAVLTGNLLRILSRKNIFLTGRIEHLSRRTLREKVLSYLSEEAVRQGSRSFAIPLDRQGLADYLAADRSALSAVLGRLRREGVLTFRKNEFTLR
ncbi:MAG TPA: Crp/Fnr family transcriptional regulator [Firmicutes bacterium]|nr:Crp/Fnr family transcriptional regulator [Bacillota bacterium]